MRLTVASWQPCLAAAGVLIYQDVCGLVIPPARCLIVNRRGEQRAPGRSTQAWVSARRAEAPLDTIDRRC